jgi:hypothetical protein
MSPSSFPRKTRRLLAPVVLNEGGVANPNIAAKLDADGAEESFSKAGGAPAWKLDDEPVELIEPRLC